MKFPAQKTALAFLGGFWAMALLAAIRPPEIDPEPIRKPYQKSSAAPATPAKRLAIFSPSLTTYLAVGGDARHIAGTTRLNLDIVLHGALRDAFPAVAAVPVLDTEGRHSKIPSDPEQLLRLAPDAILVWPHFAPPLRAVGLSVVEDDSGDPVASWLTVATVAGKIETARAFAASYRAEMRDAEIWRRSGMPLRKTRAAVVWPAPGGFYAARGTNPLARTLSLSGADNALPDSSAGAVDTEQLLLADPDTIFIPCCTEEGTPAHFYAQPALQPLAAIKNRTVYRIPAGTARMEGLIETPFLLRWMRGLPYPGAESGNLRRDMRQAYRAAYRIAVDDDFLDRALSSEENASSSGYAKFSAQAEKMEPKETKEAKEANETNDGGAAR